MPPERARYAPFGSRPAHKNGAAWRQLARHAEPVLVAAGLACTLAHADHTMLTDRPDFVESSAVVGFSDAAPDFESGMGVSIEF